MLIWLTQSGEHTLEGAEAVLFAEALSSLLDAAIAEELDDYELGVECFDNLTFGQKINVLSIIGNELLRKDTPIVPLTAVLEGAIAAVLEHIKNEITFEIDTPESGSYWRKLVIAASKEKGYKGITDETCTDSFEWEILMECLTEDVLWDRDYDDAQLYIDFPPEKSKQLKEWAGITDEYFLAIADDLTDEEAKIKIKELQKLCKLITKKS